MMQSFRPEPAPWHRGTKWSPSATLAGGSAGSNAPKRFVQISSVVGFSACFPKCSYLFGFFSLYVPRDSLQNKVKCDGRLFYSCDPSTALFYWLLRLPTPKHKHAHTYDDIRSPVGLSKKM